VWLPLVAEDLDAGGEVEVGGGVEGWDGEGRLLWWSRCGLADFVDGGEGLEGRWEDFVGGGV